MYGQADKLRTVPNPENFTPIRSIRVPDETWIPAKHGASAQGTDMSKLIREFLDWYIHLPGAKLPARLPRPAPRVRRAPSPSDATPPRDPNAEER